ncbi:MAG: hypothetical protein SWO11_22885 [Thermodesulfobacteriota bacterium]|nr:hypothetical protein [Thermodesulfobacteriota bacterium]
MIKKLILSFILIAIFLVAIAPLAVYKLTLSNVDKPVRPTILISGDDLLEYWAKYDHVENIDDISNTTPYWIYKWLIVAIFEKQIKDRGFTIEINNISKMAGLIALNHLRESDFKPSTGGMLNWHMTSINLGIWIQRNWSAIEIASKHKEINITKVST